MYLYVSNISTSKRGLVFDNKRPKKSTFKQQQNNNKNGYKFKDPLMYVWGSL